MSSHNLFTATFAVKPSTDERYLCIMEISNGDVMNFATNLSTENGEL